MIRSELRWAVRDGSFATLLVIAVLLNALSVYGNAAGVSAPHGTAGMPHEAVAKVTQNLVGLGFGGYLFSMTYGAFLGARDFGTKAVIRRSFLAGGPERLLAAKAAALLLPAAAFAIASAGAAVLAAAVSLQLRGIGFAWSHQSTIVLWGVLASVFAMSYVGLAVGWLVRNAIIGIVGLLAYTFVVETALIAIAPKVGRLLPGGAEQSVTLDTSSTHLILPVGGGYALLAGWVLALLVAGAVRSRCSDVV